ncbi:MAG: HTH domain-containing protein [Clostridia bacterium]
MSKLTVLDCLGCGLHNAITAKELALTLHTDERTITSNIQKLRASGIIILSNNQGHNKGYFLFDGNVEELGHFIASMKSRQKNIQSSVYPAIKLYNGLINSENQIQIEEFEEFPEVERW